MKYALALAFVTASAYVSAQEQGQQFVAYQNALLARAVPADVKTFCAAKAGAAAGPVFDACRVTRLFLADYTAGRSQGFPPMADLRYTNGQAEQDTLVKALSEYSR